MQIVPLASSCGVEITGVQLADAAGATLDDVREAVYAHGVAVLPVSYTHLTLPTILLV